MLTANTISDLRNNSSNTPQTVLVKHFSTPGDLGGGLFWKDASDTTSADNTGLVIVDTAGNRWKRLYNGLVSVRWFGARGNNAADDRSAIQNAINTVAAHNTTSKGNEIFFPAGFYRTSSTLIINKAGVSFLGEGNATTRIISTFAAGDVLRIDSVSGNTIDNIGFDTTVTRTSGAYINVHNTYNTRLRNLVIINGYTGISFTSNGSFYDCYVENFLINGASRNGIAAGETGTGHSGKVQNLFISNGEISNVGDHGVFLGNISGAVLNTVDTLQCRIGHVLYPSKNQEIYAVHLTACVADNCVETGIKIISNGGKITNVTLVDCWSASNGTGNIVGHGIEIGGSGGRVSNIALSCCQITNNRDHGIWAYDTQGLTLSNVISSCNSVSGRSNSHGIYINGNTSRINIHGGIFGNGGVSTTNNQSYGIYIGGGSGNYHNVIGVDALGNVSGGIYNGAGGANSNFIANWG